MEDISRSSSENEKIAGVESFLQYESYFGDLLNEFDSEKKAKLSAELLAKEKELEKAEEIIKQNESLEKEEKIKQEEALLLNKKDESKPFTEEKDDIKLDSVDSEKEELTKEELKK